MLSHTPVTHTSFLAMRPLKEMYYYSETIRHFENHVPRALRESANRPSIKSAHQTQKACGNMGNGSNVLYSLEKRHQRQRGTRMCPCLSEQVQTRRHSEAHTLLYRQVETFGISHRHNSFSFAATVLPVPIPATG